MSIEHIDTNSMIMVQLTKCLPNKVFHEHIIHMGITSIDIMLFE